MVTTLNTRWRGTGYRWCGSDHMVILLLSNRNVSLCKLWCGSTYLGHTTWHGIATALVMTYKSTIYNRWWFNHMMCQYGIKEYIPSHTNAFRLMGNWHALQRMDATQIQYKSISSHSKSGTAYLWQMIPLQNNVLVVVEEKVKIAFLVVHVICWLEYCHDAKMVCWL